MKIVLDTNVLISGLMLPKSAPGNILNSWKANQFELALSNPMLDEIARVLSYPKIRKRLQWDRATIQRFILLMRYKAEVVDIQHSKAVVPRDAADNKVLATLIESKSNYLVSGDRDLLELQEHYPVVTPAQFVGYL